MSEIDNELLLTRMIEITKFDSTNVTELVHLEDFLIATMIKLGGVGLASNQVNKRYRAFAMYIRDVPQVLFNPRVVMYSKDSIKSEEGCLSYPNITRIKYRHSLVEVEWKNYAGTKYQTWLEGQDAVCFQHELDHLNGKEWNE